MKTDALIDLLATDAGPAQRHPVARRFGAAVAFGATAASRSCFRRSASIPR